MKLVFATQNQHKAAEIQALLPSEFEVLTLNDINISEDIPETADTLEGNASQKSHYILRHYHVCEQLQQFQMSPPELKCNL